MILRTPKNAEIVDLVKLQLFTNLQAIKGDDFPLETMIASEGEQ